MIGLELWWDGLDERACTNNPVGRRNHPTTASATRFRGGKNSMSGTFKRRQKFVDRQVQGAIILRTTTYWALCMFTIASMLAVWRIVVGPPQPFLSHVAAMWRLYGPVGVASLLLLPILIIDIVAMSNRFAGPATRLRRAMRQLADGRVVDPIQFRADDYWKDFADDFNRLIVRIQAPPILPAADDSIADDSIDQETLVCSSSN